MKFLIGEGSWDWLERAAYRGGIGFYYNSTWGGVLTFIVVGLICLFTIIGIITTIKWLIGGKTNRSKKGETAEEYWKRTGHMK